MARFKIQKSKRAKDLAASLSIEDCLRQVSCPDFRSNRGAVTAAGGGFFHPDDRDALDNLIRAFKDVCDIPPLITTDMENGPGDMVLGSPTFPMWKGCCLEENRHLLRQLGSCAARHGAGVGFNSTLGPCVDIFELRDSPAVGLRSPGPEVEAIVESACHYIDGLQSNGMSATIKHFPGDGSCPYDQHLTTPENPMDKDSWWQGPGQIYGKTIDRGVHCVMPGHISLPWVDEIDHNTGMYPPATLSQRCMTDLLRGELGFEGLIISDAVEMGGFAGYMNLYDGMALFLQRGGDLLLFPKLDAAFFTEMKQRIARGLLEEATLRERVAQVLAFKETVGLMTDSQGTQMTQSDDLDEALSLDMTRNAVVVERDRLSTLPLSKGQRIAHVILEVSEGCAQEKLQAFSELLKPSCSELEEIVAPGPSALFECCRERRYDAVIVSISAPYRFGTNVTRFHGVVARNLMQGWMNLGVPCVFISHDNASFGEEYRQYPCVINAHGLHDQSIAVLTEVLFS